MLRDSSAARMGDDKVEVIAAPPTTTWAASSGCLALALLVPVVATPSRVVVVPASSAPVATESSRRRAPPIPSGSGTHVTRIREGDTYYHKVNIGTDDSTLYDSQVAWELSKTLLPQDVEVRKSRSLDEIVAAFFPS